MTPTQPAHCPTGQAGPLTTRLPRHCAACHSYAPPLGCTWPAWSEYTRAELVALFVRNLGRPAEEAQAAVLELEHGKALGPVQLALL